MTDSDDLRAVRNLLTTTQVELRRTQDKLEDANAAVAKRDGHLTELEGIIATSTARENAVKADLQDAAARIVELEEEVEALKKGPVPEPMKAEAVHAAA